MAANRGLVALVALAVLVWGVAFAGGATVALLTASADVTTTFETPDELRQIDEATASPTALTDENGTIGEDETAPPANATEPSGNASVPTGGNVSVPIGGNSSAPTGGNVSEPEDGTASEAIPPTNETDASSPPASPTSEGNASSPPETGPSQPENTDEPPANESTGGGNATDVSAAMGAFGAGPFASDRSNGR